MTFPDKIGTINPNIYGHFAEHIGGVIYDGLWVGTDSSTPNINGFRKELVELLKELNPPVIRWPGGCFAETHDWRDGIGSQSDRPTTVNWWYNDDRKLESNKVGTHEFVEFCRLVGAEPYFAANVTSISPLETRNWIEYCNFPMHSTTLANARAANGSPEPFNIKYWGIGNENWGGGGNFTPDDYCTEFRRVGKIVSSLSTDLELIACGPDGNDLEWTRRFFEKWQDQSTIHGTSMSGYSVHYYCGTAGSAVDYSIDQWYELLHKALYMENILVQQRGIMDQYDPQRKIGIIVDEWGCWHPDGSGPSRGGNLFEQQSTMRDALVAAMTLNIFNNHCDSVAMANVAQLVNNLHSLFLAANDRLITTPNYHVFNMYKEHQNAKALRTIVECENITYQKHDKSDQFPSINCSASYVDDMITITITNADYSKAKEVEVSLLGLERVRFQTKVSLTANDPHDYNSFEDADCVSPVETQLGSVGTKAVISLPEASVVQLGLKICK